MVTIGDNIPNISVQDHSGKTINLFDLNQAEKKKIVIYFYPKDDTPGCTKESCSFRDNYDKYQENNALIFGVSKDGLKSHIKFINKYNLPFTLLTDPELELTKKFRAYGKKRSGSFGLIRSTFVADENGKIVAIFGLKDYPKVNTSTHGEDVLEVLK